MKKIEAPIDIIKFVLFTALLCACTCIERNNPWDPINGCPNDYRIEIRQKALPKFESYVTDAQYNYTMLIKQMGVIDSLNAKNDSVRTQFLVKQKKLDSTFNNNEVIDSTNRIDCKVMIRKLKVDTFPSYTFFNDSINIRNFRSSITKDSTDCLSQIYSDNNKCQPHGIYSVEFQDSLLSIFDHISIKAESLTTIIKKFNANITDTNLQVITQHNIYIKRYNLSVDRYNDSISLAMEYCKTDWISNPGDIKKKIDTLKPGDTLSIDSGMHVVEIKFSNFGDSTHPLIIQGTPFGNTTLSYPDFSIDHSHNIIIRNITFLNSRTRGLTIENNSSAIKLEKCTIVNSAENGLEVLNSVVTVENCVFRENSDGIYCNGLSAKIDVKNVLIIKNRKSGIECNQSQLSVSKATISDNGISGINLTNQRNSLSIVSTLLTFNSSFGLEHINAEMSDISLYYSVFYQNSSGDFRGDSSQIIIDISCKHADPQFTSRELNDYAVGNPELSILGYTP